MGEQQPTSSEARPPASPTRGVIELRLQTINQLFNSMDPSPFPEKDLDSNAEEFIVSWAWEYPRNVPLVLLVHLSQPPHDGDPAALIEDAIHAYFAHKTALTRRHFRRMMARGRLSLAIGVVFLGLCLFASDMLRKIGTATPIQILRESVIIGGWVAMWGPMQIFLYDWWPLLSERKVYERLSRATVKVMLRD